MNRLQALRRQLDRFQDLSRGEQLRYFGVTTVHSNKGAGNLRRELHHAPTIRSGSLGEHLRMAGIHNACGSKCLFVDRCCGDRIDGSIERRINGRLDVLITGSTALRGYAPNR